MATKIEVELKWSTEGNLDVLRLGEVGIAILRSLPSCPLFLLTLHAGEERGPQWLECDSKAEARIAVELLVLSLLGAKRSFHAVIDGHWTADGRWWSARHQSDTDNST